MSKRTRGQRIWLETPADPHHDVTIGQSTSNPKSAHYGIVVTCTDERQGTYTAHTKEGLEWLVVRGSDDVFDIIDSPTERGAHCPKNSRIIAAVKVFIKRNER